MLTAIHPKLPMRDKAITRNYYINQLGFRLTGTDAHEDYLMLIKDQIEIHFFLFKDLDPDTNDGQVYIRSNDINLLYQQWRTAGVPIHPNGPLQDKPWGQREFSLLDPDSNLLTFGQAMQR
ncbi:VOC family protein [Niabella terrae]